MSNSPYVTKYKKKVIKGGKLHENKYEEKSWGIGKVYLITKRWIYFHISDKSIIFIYPHFTLIRRCHGTHKEFF